MEAYSQTGSAQSFCKTSSMITGMFTQWEYAFRNYFLTSHIKSPILRQTMAIIYYTDATKDHLLGEDLI